ERAQARALLGELAAEAVDGALALLDLRAHLLQLGLELLLALRRRGLALAQALEARAQLVRLLRELDGATLELLALGAQAVEARAGLVAAALEPLEHRLRARDALRRLADPRARRAHGLLGLLGRELALVEDRDLALELGLLGALDLLELGERREQGVALLREHRAALGEG